MGAVKSFFKSRAFRIGMYSAISSVIVIAIAVGVIMITDELPTTYTKLDMTTGQLYSISEQTEKIVGGIDKDVEIYLLAQTGNEDDKLLNMLKKYEALSGKVKVILKDPVVYPSFVQQYTTETVYENSVIVVSGDRSRYISYYEIFIPQFDYSVYPPSIVSVDFYGESCVTSAIDYVTSSSLPKTYLITGHGEKELNQTISNMIAKNNINTETLNLLTVERVPEDAECLIINGPTADIPQEETDKIGAYLKSGGNLLLITDVTDVKMPNLSTLLEDYGVEKVEGMVLEGDPNYCYYLYAHYLLPKINAHVITNPLRDGGYYVLMPIASGITVLDGKRDTITVEKLLATSDSAYSKVDIINMTSAEKEEGDIDGPFSIGVAITDNVDDVESKIVWFTSSSLLDPSINERVSDGNFNLFLNSLNWMCEREEKISIHPKTIKEELLMVPAAAATRWSILIVGVVPAAFLIAGISVWVRRRRR